MLSVDNLNADLIDGLSIDAFLLADGSKELIANWDAGSFKITAETFQSDITTGTSPFTVASSTMVNNLNSQYLGGKQITDIDYALISSNDAGTDVTAAELETLTAGPASIADALHTHTSAAFDVVRGTLRKRFYP